MRILGRKLIVQFAAKHADARKRLAGWQAIMEKATWKNSEDMKRTFNSVDIDGCETIFDIGGNNFRLIALVDYEAQTVTVTNVMTHAEYNRR